MGRRIAVSVSRKAERSGSKGCPSIDAYVLSFVAKSDWISSDFMAGEVSGS